MFITFDNPRRWMIRLYGPMTEQGARYRRHQSIGVVSNNAETALREVEKHYPEWRLESCADTGEVHYIVNHAI
jgi:hypothetical protein